MAKEPGTHVVDSPDGTSLRAGDRGQIVCNGLSYWMSEPAPEVGRQVMIDGVIDAKTEHVRILYKGGGELYQCNADRNWYMHTPDGGWPWQECEDPRRPGEPEQPPIDTAPPELPGAPHNGAIDFSDFAEKVVHATLFGIGTGALCDHDFAKCEDELIVSQLARIAPRCFRLHCGNRLAEKVANGDMLAFQRWLRAFPDMLPADAMQIVGVGPDFENRNYSPEQRGEHAAALARAFIDAGYEVFNWEVGNECEGLGVDLYSDHYIACADALHAVNRNYNVGGTVSMWWGSIDIEQWVRRVTPERIGAFIFHSYPCAGASSAEEIYQKAVNWGDARSARNALRNAGVPDSVPIRLLEWNQDGADHGGIWGSPMQIDHRGAVYFGLMLQTAHESDVLLDAGACWDAVADSYFGQVGPAPDYDNNFITPSGHYLGVAGRCLSGEQVRAVTDLGNFRVLCVVHGKQFALQCINYDTHKAQTYNPQFSGVTVASFDRRFDVGKYNHAAAEVPVSLPIEVPEETICIVTGTLQ